MSIFGWVGRFCFCPLFVKHMAPLICCVFHGYHKERWCTSILQTVFVFHFSRPVWPLYDQQKFYKTVKMILVEVLVAKWRLAKYSFKEMNSCQWTVLCAAHHTIDRSNSKCDWLDTNRWRGGRAINQLRMQPCSNSLGQWSSTWAKSFPGGQFYALILWLTRFGGRFLQVKTY